MDLHQLRRPSFAQCADGFLAFFPVGGGNLDLDQFMIVQRPFQFLLQPFRQAFVADHDDRFEVVGDGAVFTALFG